MWRVNMDRRGFLSALGIGAIGLAKADLSLGGDSQAQQTTHTTTEEGTTTFGEDFTITANPNGQVTNKAQTLFQHWYNETIEEGSSFSLLDDGSLNDTLRLIGSMFYGGDLEVDGQRIIFKITREEMVRRVAWYGEGFADAIDTNVDLVACVAGALAGAIASELQMPSSVDVYLLMEYEDRPLDGDREPEVYLNQRYRIKGEWARAYVTGEMGAYDVLSSALGTAHTNRTTTATTTTEVEEEDEWSWSYGVMGSDGTLELITGAMEGGHTLLGQYDGYASYLRGVVENVSGSTLRYAEVQANFYVNNTVQAQGLANMRNLPTGDRWQFEAVAPDSVAFTYAGLYLSGTTY